MKYALVAIILMFNSAVAELSLEQFSSWTDSLGINNVSELEEKYGVFTE